MTPAKFIAYSLCDAITKQKVSSIIENFISNDWLVREVDYKPTPYDQGLPPFDKGRDFEIGFPEATFSRMEFLTRGDKIVQARARLNFKQALIFAKASKHVWHLKGSLDYYYGVSSWSQPQPSTHMVCYENDETQAYLTRTISDGCDTLVYCVGNKQLWR